MKRGRTVQPRRGTAQARLSAILRATQAVASSLDLEEVLRAIVREASAIAGTPVVRLFLLEEETQVLRYRVGLGLPLEAARDLVIPVGESFSGMVAATGKPLAVPDCRGDSRLSYPQHTTKYGLISYLGLPVRLANRSFGVLVFNTEHPRTYSDAEIAYLTAFADQAAIAIENARLHGAAVRRGEELEALLRGSGSVMAGLDLQTTLQRIVDEAAHIARTPHVKLLLVDKEAQVVRLAALAGGPVPEGFAVPLGTSYSGTVATSGQALFIADTQNDPRNLLRERDREHGIRTFLGLPVKGRVEILGVLTFNTEQPHQYGREELAYLQSFADQAAVAIENARLHETTVKRAQQLATLNELTRTLTTTLDPQAVAQEILEAVRRLIPEATGRLWEQVGEAEVYRLAASIGLREMENGDTRQIRPGEGMIGIAVAMRQPVSSQDVTCDPRYINQAWAAAEGLKSCIMLPLVHGEQVKGALAIYTRTPYTFTDEEVSLLQSFAAQAAIALENARLYAAAAAQAAELHTLREIGQAITAQLELAEVLQAVVAGTMRLLGNPFAQIILWDEARQTLRFGAAQGPEAERVRNQTFALGRGINGTVAQTRQPMILDDYQASPYAVPECFDIVATISVPVLFGDRLLGVLHSHSTEVGRRFTSDDLRRLQMLATQAAIAIENARLYGGMRQTAREARSLYEVAHSLTTSLDPLEVLELIAVKTTDLLGTPHAQVVLWDEEAQTLRLGEAYGTEAEKAREQQFFLGEGVNGIVAQTKSPLFVNDYQAFSNRVPGLTEVVADIAVPLLYRGRLLGVLNSHATQPGWQFTQDHVSLLTSFADQAAVAIENARLYQQVQAHAAALEERVEERTRALKEAQAELVQSAKLAAVGTLAAGVAHELNQPLTVIRGYAQGLLAEEGLPAEARADLDRIQAQTIRMARIINHLRDFSRQSKGVFEPVALNEVVEEAFLLVTQQLRARNIEAVRELDPELPLLQGDRIQLEQVFVNLITNARDAMTPQGGGRLTVTTRVVGRSVVAAVADTGPGVPAAIRDRIFDPFFTTKEVGQGTGLGLSISYGIIQEHGGEVHVENGAGGGAVFTVRLPVVEPGN